jgi:hypothetical protein
MAMQGAFAIHTSRQLQSAWLGTLIAGAVPMPSQNLQISRHALPLLAFHSSNQTGKYAAPILFLLPCSDFRTLNRTRVYFSTLELVSRFSRGAVRTSK